MGENVDLKDRKILYELDGDARQSNKQIAKKVGLSEQVVGNRIRRLQELGVIEYFYAKTNPSILGFMHIKIYLRWHNLTKKQEDEVLQGLRQQEGIFWLASLRGKYDLVASVYVKNIADFSKRYDEIFGKWGGYIQERNVIVLEKAYTYSKAYLVPKQKSEEILYSAGGEKSTDLDDLDLKLLSLLSKKGRQPLVEIGQQFNVSSDTVRYRITNLQRKGIITGFSVKIDFSKLHNHYFLLFLKLQNMNKLKYASLQTLAKLNKNVIVFIKTIGDHDIELEVETANKEELDELLKSLRDYFTNEIQDYELFEVTREHLLIYFPF